MNGGLLARVWLPGWLYHLLPFICLFAGICGCLFGYFWLGLPLAGYALLIVDRRATARKLRSYGLLALLLAVPTITPVRTILVNVRSVQILSSMDLIAVQARTGTGPTKTTLTARVMESPTPRKDGKN